MAISSPVTILITGATGTVSTNLIDILSQWPAVRLRAMVRDPARATAFEKRGIATVQGDLDDPGTLPGAFDGVDALWLLTAPGPRASENSMNALWAARRAGVQRVVRLSAVGAAADAPTRNGRLHAQSDHEIMVSGLQWTILKPHFYMQNLLAVAPAIAGQSVLPYALGDGRLGLIDTRDVADFAAQIFAAPAAHAGRTYTLTGTASLSGDDMAHAISDRLGRPIRYVPMSLDATRQFMTSAGASPWIVGMYLEYCQAYANGWGDFVTRDFTQLIQRPARSLSDFVRDHAAAFGAPS
ncbi:uncharacterized protein YbjT (DUF2867 family) [Luteibacter rhizovicinus]|uniref:Uncharacterized protein YbjT (DUF2867 family) n=1 Tax=Luteibacter rhizovicinus TaxID=242606 RepID=A0A4R3YJG5_9GAMM|nr:SDR family oxidoreductase [Luteibacter rhizovicinus]TCV92376.1 uncharacterized protein YbjT (DUF2867 family) [Luteibacter rhizovicinus]